MKSVELFAGAGGLGLGLSLAGFEPAIVIEWDKWACDTIRENKTCGYPLVKDWNIFEGDARCFDYSSISGEIDLISGGPPCQPFSLGGKHKAFKDERDMFPVAVDAVRKLSPQAFMFENVKGITRASFANYFQYIILQLTYPEITIKENEDWLGHLSRLERQKTSGKNSGLTYNVIARVLNAANYGVPQHRERVFIVGFRSDQNQEWSFPEETHSLDSLLHEQWVSKNYWERHEISIKKRSVIPSRYSTKVKKLRQTSLLAGAPLRPWRTVRDAIHDLPSPQTKKTTNQIFHDHNFQSGAKAYPGHTGSPLDFPAKTLKAGDHGVPGGENMMVGLDGTVRYFTIRESARLQTFPDGYKFHGSWTETMRQLGNAVPVHLARIVGASVAIQLLRTKELEMKQKISGIAA
jgi:DNA (cytosine-5)-methyltransferase 1